VELQFKPPNEKLTRWTNQLDFMKTMLARLKVVKDAWYFYEPFNFTFLTVKKTPYSEEIISAVKNFFFASIFSSFVSGLPFDNQTPNGFWMYTKATRKFFLH
jgi:hypothetical protein